MERWRPYIVPGIALAYFLTGRLGLELAIPPGYATAIWPPSGIALAAIMLWGPRVWPGILLGSTLNNLPTGFDQSSPLALAVSLGVPFAIGVGATVQALLGGTLMRRFGGYPNPLSEVEQIGRLLLFGGAVSCLLNATNAVLLLYLSGRIGRENVPFSWATWWSGDVIGVFVFTPVAIALLSPDRRNWDGRRLPVSLCLGTTFALTVSLVAYTATFEREKLRGEFADASRLMASELEKTIALQFGTVGSMEALAAVLPNPGREPFEAFGATIISHLPALAALEWAVNAGTLAHPVFETLYRLPHEGLAPEADVIAGLRDAQEAGRLTVTAPIALTPGDAPDAFAVIIPVGPGGGDRPGPQAEATGYAIGIFRIAPLVEAAFAGSDLSSIHYWLTDAAATKPPVIAMSNAEGPPSYFRLTEHGIFGGDARLAEQFDIDVGSRRWTFETAPTQSFIARFRFDYSWTVLVAGMLFTGVIGAFVMVVTGREVRLLELVEERTAALEESQQSQRLLVDGVVDCAIYMLDAGGQVLNWNRGAERLTGYTATDIIGKPFGSFFTAADRAASVPERLLAIAKRQRRFVGGGWGLRKDGSQFWGSVIIDPIVDADNLVGYGVVTRDETDRRRSEARLRETMAELERSNRHLQQFAAVASHDLKAPLRAIQRLAGWIAEDLRGKVDDEVQKNLTLLRKRGERLQILLDGLLDYAGAGRGVAPAEPVDLAEMVEEIAWYLSLPEGFTVEPRGVLPVILADKTALEQVVRNLMSNAVMHHDRGEGVVAISVQLRSGMIEIRIEDDGPGILPEHHKRIFEMFQTLKPRDQLESSGMGLAIVAKLVENAGGAIRVESEPPRRGTVFIVDWPLADRSGDLPRGLS